MKKYADFVDDTNWLKFSEMLSYVTETFDTRLPVTYKYKSNHKLGYFSYCGYDFLIKFSKYDNVYTVKFYKKNNEDVYQTFAPSTDNLQLTLRVTLAVLNTVQMEILDFITNNNPDCLMFSASDKSDGRKKLYQNFGDHVLQNTTGYTTKQKTISEHVVVFLIYKTGYDYTQNITTEYLAMLYDAEFLSDFDID